MHIPSLSALDQYVCIPYVHTTHILRATGKAYTICCIHSYEFIVAAYNIQYIIHIYCSCLKYSVNLWRLSTYDGSIRVIYGITHVIPYPSGS